MLDQSTIRLIKASVPILVEHGETITKHFYYLMFGAHPELKNIFNMVSQKNGTQPKSLAQSILAYAQHIERLQDLSAMVGKIAHKHAGLNVKAEHYPIVGKYLLQALGDVLGEAASPELLEAWEKAYNLLADILIRAEQNIYDKQGAAEGGWKDFRKFIISKKVKESETITSFYLVPRDNKPIMAFKPGQSLTVRIQLPNASYTSIRNYSLSDVYNPNYYRISVKRASAYMPGIEEGIVSNFMHNELEEGDLIEVHAPVGNFIWNPANEKHTILISGGIGITPLLCMAKAWSEIKYKKPLWFIHGTQNSQTYAFRQEIEQIAEQNANFKEFIAYSDPIKTDIDYDMRGYIDITKFNIPKDAEIYFCGPAPFMTSIWSDLKTLGFRDEQLHFEQFGPGLPLRKKSIDSAA